MEMDIQNILDKIMQVMPQLVYSIVGVVLILFVLVVFVPMLEVSTGAFLLDAIDY